MSIDHQDFIFSLLSKPSISPDDQGCQLCIEQKLKALGFVTENLHSGAVTNLWSKRGASSPLLVFAGHTDVVPSGALAQWQFPPFTPIIDDERLYARGACDMKVALACMVLAVEQFVCDYPKHQGSIGFLVTSCEEEKTDDGTSYVMKALQKKGEVIDWCVVGEPASEQCLGDQIKIGRRGSLLGQLKVRGQQGHIAYPHLAINPIHSALTPLNTLIQTNWDDGTDVFQPTSFQISYLDAGTGASNVIPADLEVRFNFRYSPATSADQLKLRVNRILNQSAVDYELDWSHSGEPFLTKKGRLIDAVDQAIQKVTQKLPQHATSGGISDARFIAPYGIEVIELGFCHHTAHQINEHIAIADIPLLKDIYYHILLELLA